MDRPSNNSRHLRAILGLVIVFGVGASRTEKIWAQSLNGLDLSAPHFSVLETDLEAFDPARVPQSGGMASRLLSGINVKHD
jgi:hypothetical protein